jgi:hypothetical protein
MNKKSKFKDFNLKVQGTPITTTKNKNKKVPLYKIFEGEITREKNIIKVLNRDLYQKKF